MTLAILIVGFFCIALAVLMLAVFKRERRRSQHLASEIEQRYRERIEEQEADYEKLQETYAIAMNDHRSLRTISEHERQKHAAEVRTLEEKFGAVSYDRDNLEERLSDGLEKIRSVRATHREEMNRLCSMTKTEAMEGFQTEANRLKERREELASRLSDEREILALKQRDRDAVVPLDEQIAIESLKRSIAMYESMLSALQERHSEIVGYLERVRTSVDEAL